MLKLTACTPIAGRLRSVVTATVRPGVIVCGGLAMLGVVVLNCSAWILSPLRRP